MQHFFLRLKATIFSYSALPSKNKGVSFVALLLLIVALPVTLVAVQQKTNTQQHAAAIVDAEGWSSCAIESPPGIFSSDAKYYCVFPSNTAMDIAFSTDISDLTKTIIKPSTDSPFYCDILNFRDGSGAEHDPQRGTVKTCFMRTAPTLVPSGFKEFDQPCIEGNTSCSYSGTVNIEFGADGHYLELTNQSSGSIDCDKAPFYAGNPGSTDPAPNTIKECFWQAAGGGGNPGTTCTANGKTYTDGDTYSECESGTPDACTTQANSVPSGHRGDVTIHANSDGTCSYTCADGGVCGGGEQSSAPSGPPGYTYCSAEYSTCNFTGTQDVAFGINGLFTFKPAVGGGIACTRAAFGGDPAPGVVKACFTKPPTGYVDNTSCQIGLTGWTCPINGIPAPVGLFADAYPSTSTVPLAVGVANLPRSDAAAIAQICGTTGQPGAGNYGFSLPLPQAFADNKTHGYLAATLDSSNHVISTITPLASSSLTCAGTGGGGGGNVANVSLVVGLPGIGQITGPVGVLPQHLTRTVIVELYDASVFNPGGPGTKAVASGKASITYDDGKGSANNAGYFDSVTGGAVPLQISLPVNPPATNEYKIVVEIPQYLHRIALPLTQADQNNPEAFVITSGSTVQMQPLILVPGDVVGVNSMGIDDYTQMKTCFDTPTDPTCTKTPDGIPFADLDDNGVIDLVDFNLFIRSLSLLEQIQPPVCNGLTCIGD